MLRRGDHHVWEMFGKELTVNDRCSLSEIATKNRTDLNGMKAPIVILLAAILVLAFLFPMGGTAYLDRIVAELMFV